MKYGLLFKILVILGISPVCASKFYEILSPNRLPSWLNTASTIGLTLAMVVGIVVAAKANRVNTWWQEQDNSNFLGKGKWIIPIVGIIGLVSYILCRLVDAGHLSVHPALYTWMLSLAALIGSLAWPLIVFVTISTYNEAIGPYQEQHKSE